MRTMTDGSAESLRRVEDDLAEARAAGDDVLVTELLARYTTNLVIAGRLDEAVAVLDEAAELNGALGRDDRRAQCLHHSASLRRMQGRFDDAIRRAAAAREVSGAPIAARVAAAAELAQTHETAGEPEEALRWYTAALEEGEDLAPPARASLLRRRAAARAGTGDPRGAADDAERAAELLATVGEPEAAFAAEIESASALLLAGDRDAAVERIISVTARATEAGDQGALADLALLATTVAVQDGRVDDAVAAATEAKQHALASRSVVAYLSASVHLSELEEHRGDRVAAYAALATAWVTLSDLIGRDEAKGLIEPRLQAMVDRWGANDFALVKAEYERRRRDQRG